MEGYVLLSRKIIDNPMYFSEPFTRTQAWIDMIMIANYKPGFFRVRGIKVEVKRGQIGYTAAKLGSRWQWSKNKVLRYLKELENDMQIETQKNNVTTLITVINYDTYQTGETQKELQTERKTANKRHTKKTQKDLNNKDNIDKSILSSKKEIDKSISLNEISSEEREKIFQIFFFEKGIINPEKEIQRFIAHYEKTGWKDAHGNAIVSKTACALNWTTKEVTGSYSDFMNRWKIIYYEGAKQYPDACRIMYQGLKGVMKENSTITLTAKKELWEFVENSEPQLSNLICGLIKKNLPGYNFKWNVLKN